MTSKRRMMASFALFDVVLAILAAISPNLTLAADSPSPSRFSPEALELFAVILDEYDLNNRTVPFKKRDREQLLRLAESSNSKVANAAKLAVKQMDFKAMQINAYKKKMKVLNADYSEEFGAKNILRLLRQRNDETGNNIYGNPITLFQDLFVTPIGLRTNDVLSATFFGLSCNLALKQAMRNIAAPVAATTPGEEAVITVRLESRSKTNAYLRITNGTNTDWHHCVLFSRCFSNPQRVLATSAQAEIWQSVLEAVNTNGGKDAPIFSPNMVNAIGDGNRLRAAMGLLEDGVMIYVPEIPANANVKLWLCPTRWLQFASSAEVALWCDEISIDGRSAENFGTPRRQNRLEAGFPKTRERQNDQPVAEEPPFRRLAGPTGLLPQADGSRRYSFSCCEVVGDSFRETGKKIQIEDNGRYQFALCAKKGNMFIVQVTDTKTRRRAMALIPSESIAVEDYIKNGK